METKSVSRQDFSPKKGERYAAKKPCDSDILFGDCSFRTETHSQTQEQQKQDGSIMEMKKKYCNAVDTENLKATPELIVYDIAEHNRAFAKNGATAYTETFYEGVPAEDVRRVILRENHELKLPENHLEDQSFQVSCEIPTASTTQIQMTSTKLQESMLWQNGQIKAESQYNTDFVPKLKSCPAGELIASIAKNHSSTEHFEFYRILGGHHFYEPKVDNVQKT
ncbi:unnamed protein product [Onchocerca flexuosa]|uniref:BB_PF domain-containing protein n=1 Tax=Onchocerca flexuosa TaxID=387005 RepID=A0A183H0M9_9BILA|nr:unnamed protein product [Onchocerca flexuosa]